MQFGPDRAAVCETARVAGSDGRGRRRARGELSRTRLLDAGLDAFNELSLADLLSEIGPRRVARQLGDVSVGAFHHHFPTQADYIADLAAHGLSSGRDEIAPGMASALFGIVNLPDPDALGHLVRISNLEFGRQRTAGMTTMQFRMCLWSKHDDPSAREALRQSYQRVDESLVPAFEALLERWGRELRPPFTMHSAVALTVALFEGLTLRSCVDRDVADPTLFAVALQALAPMMSRALGDKDDLDRAVAPIARFARGPRGGSRDPEARRRLLDATVAAADADAFDDATVDDLAASADASVEAVYTEFQGKPGLAAAAFARFMPLLERPMKSDLDDGLPSSQVVTRHLERLADIAGRHRGLMNAVIDAVQRAAVRYGSHIGPNDPRALVPLASMLAPVIEAGQARGELRHDYDAYEVAVLITNLTLVQIMARPDDDPTRTVQSVAELTLFGMAPRPATAT